MKIYPVIHYRFSGGGKTVWVDRNIGQVTIDGVQIVASRKILNRLKKAHKEVA
jgi:hypothetical protein